MANIFTLNHKAVQTTFDPKDENYQIGSVAYINFIAKKLTDAFNNSIGTNKPIEFEDIDTNEGATTVEINTTSGNPNNIYAESITTDPNHKFLTAAQVEIFKDKPSSFEMKQAIMSIRNELKILIEKRFNDILNTPDALERIKIIMEAIKEDEDIDELISLLANKIGRGEFKDHITSEIHINNNDRKALNALIGFIASGCADWDASEGAANYIRNKPDSLPANGGNADTVGGYEPKELLNHQTCNLIIGKHGNRMYSKDSCDMIISSNNETNYSTKDALEAIYKAGSVALRDGVYTFGKFEIDANASRWTTISGSRNSIIESVSAAKVNGKIIFKDITFRDSTIMIGSDCEFDHVLFDNCEVIFNISSKLSVMNCLFDNCQIKFDGACTDNIIAYNRFRYCVLPMYYNGNNTFDGNIII